MHYESALQRGEEPLNNSGVSVAEWGRLKCLQGLGHLRTVQRQVENLIRTRPNAPPALAEAGAAAAWRLGQWDDLKSLLGKIDSDNSSHASVGVKRSHRHTGTAPSALTPSGVPLTMGSNYQLNTGKSTAECRRSHRTRDFGSSEERRPRIPDGVLFCSRCSHHASPLQWKGATSERTPPSCSCIYCKKRNLPTVPSL